MIPRFVFPMAISLMLVLACMVVFLITVACPLSPGKVLLVVADCLVILIFGGLAKDILEEEKED